jgi:hypothetical protein
LTLNEQGIVALLERYDKESKAIKQEVLKTMWYMRGNISYDEAFMLSNQDRDLINKVIEENLETTKTSGMPFF